MKRIRRKTLIDHVCREKRKFIPEGKKTFTALDLLEMDGFQDNLKLTLVLYDFDLIPKEVCNEFACRCAERALSRVENPDPRSVAAIAAKRAWVHGKMTDAELQSAWYAAYNAVLDTARANRFDALHAAMDSAIIDARDSAWEASYAAAWAADAARAATGDAARAAASDAARDAERTWQVEELKKMLRGAET